MLQYLSVETILQSKPSINSEKLHEYFTNTKHEKKWESSVKEYFYYFI